MKKQFLFTFVMLLAVAMTSCNTAKKEFKESIEKLNKECPIQGTENEKLLKVLYENDEVVFDYDVSIDKEQAKALNRNIDILKEKFHAECYLPTSFVDLNSAILKVLGYEKMLDFINTLVKIESNFCIKYHAGGEVIEIRYSLADLQKIVNESLSMSEAKTKYVDAEIKSSQLMMPVDLGDGAIMNDIFRKNDCVVWVLEIDEDAMGINFKDLTAKQRSDFADYMKSAMPGPSATDSEFNNMLIDLNLNITFRFVGNKSKKWIDVIWSVAEIRQIERDKSKNS